MDARETEHRRNASDEFELAILKTLHDCEQDAGGPGKSHQAGNGDHAFKQIPFVRQTDTAAQGSVFQEREIERRAKLGNGPCDDEESCPDGDFEQMHQHDQPACKNDVAEPPEEGMRAIRPVL
ncbi:MAG: hypothetical protein CAPSK01_004711 [Candidatus Accumulibacter vicinus]|uniref:Uncharacterized protein n=1 Tax=Candidatus Accumulibacter vicinus TaxID=2954382 RepID=A0A084XTS9_9PROT|nr:MAG: hypothetical protein CAPSK01_004711 [Candidatus Accumulibacter vicinus]